MSPLGTPAVAAELTTDFQDLVNEGVGIGHRGPRIDEARPNGKTGIDTGA